MRSILSTVYGPAFSLATLAYGLGGCTTEPSDAPLGSSREALLGLDADVSVTITDQVAEVSPGMPTTYRIVVRNAGPLPALIVDFRTVFPANLEQITWTCVNAGNLLDGCPASGVGTISDRYQMLAGATTTYTVRGIVSQNTPLGSTLTASAGTRVYNVLNVLLADKNPGNDSASDTDAIIAPAQVPGSLTATSGNGQITNVATAMASPVTVQLKDTLGAPIANAPVSFSVSTLGAGAAAQLSVTSAFTDTQGKASTQATVGNTAGAFQITARAGTLDPVVFGETAKAGAPASITVVPGSTPQSAGTSQAVGPFAVLVKDIYGNPVQGANVSFGAPGLGASLALSATHATTGADGIASVTGTTNATLGVYVVNASVGGVLLPAQFVVTNIAGSPTTLGAAVSSGTAVAGSAFDPIVLSVLTGGGLPLIGSLITVDGSAGVNVGAINPSDNTGHVSIPLTAGHVAGDYTVTVSVAGGLAPVTLTLHVLPDAPAKLTADAASFNQTTRVGTTFSQPIGATLYDQYDNRIPGAAIGFVAPLLWGSFAATSVVTDAQGHASSLLTAGEVAGSRQATMVSPNVLVSASVGVQATAGTPNAVSSLSLLPRKAIVGTPYLEPLGVHVQDAFGNPVAAAVVRYTGPAAGASADLSNLVATTDVLGNAQVTATANHFAGSFGFQAGVDGTMSNITFPMENLAGNPAQMTLAAGSSPQSALVGTAFAQPLGLSVKDQWGNPVQGASVAFLSDVKPAGAVVLPLALSDASGTVSMPATANLFAGPYLVHASIAAFGVTSSFALENLAAAPGTVLVDSGADQHALATQAFTHPLVVRFLDSGNHPVQGAQVSVSVPSNGATATFAPQNPTTDADGRASLALSAGAQPGAFQISLAASGAAAPATATMTIDAIPTTLVLGTQQASVTRGDAVTFDVQSSAQVGTPAGAITVTDAEAAIGGATLANGHAAVVAYFDVSGQHSIRAHLAAQGSYAGSDSAAFILTVTDPIVTPPAPDAGTSGAPGDDAGSDAGTSGSSGDDAGSDAGSSGSSDDAGTSSGEVGTSSSGGSSSSSSSSGGSSTSSSSSGGNVSSSSSSGGSSSSSGTIGRGDYGSSGQNGASSSGSSSGQRTTSGGNGSGGTSGGSKNQAADNEAALDSLSGGGGCSTSGSADSSGSSSLGWLAGLGAVLGLRRRARKTAR